MVITTGDIDDGRRWGDELRRWREVRMGWSQAEFCEHYLYHAGHLGEYKNGKLAGITEKDVWRWESGSTRKVHYRTRRVLAAMGAPTPSSETKPTHTEVLPALSWTADDIRHAVRPASTRLGTLGGENVGDDVGAAVLIHHVTREDLTVDSRDLDRLFAPVLVGEALVEQVDRWLSSETAAPRRDRSPGSIGRQELGELETAAQVFRNWDDRFGGGLRRKAVIGQLNDVSDLLRSGHPADVSRRLHVVMAELCETAAMMSWDTGHQAAAQSYYLMALRAAHTGGDVVFEANVLAGLARQLLYVRQPSTALHLVEMAKERVTGRSCHLVRSMLHAREAWAHSAIGDLSAFRTANDHAMAELDRTTGDDPHWIVYYGPAELHGTIGGRFLELARQQPVHADAAIVHITNATTARDPDRLRSCALDEIGLAEAHLLRGEIDEALAIGEAALSAANETSSDRVRVQLADFCATAASSSEPSIIDLSRRMTASANSGRTI